MSSVTLVGSSASDNNDGQDTNQTLTVKETNLDSSKEEQPTEKYIEKPLQMPPEKYLPSKSTTEKQATTYHRVSISKPDMDKKMERTISEDTEGT